jgi:hypothetical protein
MTFSKGGTITLSGKTYNISQINSVYIGGVPRYGGGLAAAVWVMGGIVGFFLFWGSLAQSIGTNAAGILWLLATVAATIGCVIMGSIEDHAVFFDMSSGKVSAYSNPDKNKVEVIKADIIKGLEEGYFPNYLQGR